MLNKDSIVSRKEIADTLSISVRSVSNDLNYIADLCQDILHISTSSAGSSLILDKKANFLTVQRCFYQDSSTHQFLHWLCFQTNVSLEDAAKALHTSTSTIKRIIARANKIIGQYYDISISTTPLGYKGEEHHIQVFLVDLLDAMHSPLNWPFKHLSDEQSLTNCLTNIALALNIPLDYKKLRYLKLATCVSWLRLRQGHKFHLGNRRERIIDEARDILGMPRFHSCLRTSSIMNALSFDEDLLSQTFAIFMNQAHLIDLNSYSDDVFIEESRLFFQDKVEELIERFSLKLEDTEAYYRQIVSNIRLIPASLEARTLFVDRITPFNERVQAFNPDFYQALRAMTQEYLDSFLPRYASYDGYIVSCLYKYWPNLITQLQDSHRKLQGLVITSYDMGFTQMKADLLNRYLGFMIQFEAIDLAQIKSHQLSQMPHQIIISDFFMDEIPGKLIFNILDLPTTSDAYKIIQRISQSDLQIESINQSTLLDLHPEIDQEQSCLNEHLFS